jgi:hypothetical protein
MRGVCCLLLLAGCDTVFGFDNVEPFDALCLGRNGEGHAGLFDHCLSVQPPHDLAGVVDIDTDADAMCTELVTQGDAARTEVCLVAARTIEINAFVTAHGKRPLVLAAIETLRVTSAGTISVASVRRSPTGAGGNFDGCGSAGLDGTNAFALSGGSGGAGGSFQGLGGGGGPGNGTPTEPAAKLELEPGFVRGGCPGGGGGNGAMASGGGRGAGGGGVYLMAGRTMTIEGTINASGESGGGGSAGIANVSGGGGGGAAGSGGLIGLDAPYITLAASARLAANGGGGGGGGSSTQPGKNGGEADLTSATPFGAAGGDGGSTTGGGRGGDGGLIDAAATAGSAYGAGGGAGGGGGGAAGYIKLFAISVTDAGASVTPAPG